MVPSNRPGIHFLRSARVAESIVRRADPGAGSLVVDLGAGAGAMTAPLSATGARVLAVERDPRFAARLRARFDGHPRVRVVQADARTVRLPRAGFHVVANLPFAVATPLLRRLLDPERPGFRGADLIVEWGHAKRLTAPRPRDAPTAWWAARYAVDLHTTVPARCFSPRPSVDCAHLVIRRRELSPARLPELRRLVAASYGPDRAVRKLVPAAALRAAGVPLAARTGDLTAEQLHRLVAGL